MAKYEVAIYNEIVRKRVEGGEHHPRFDDDWADLHYLEIRAADEDQARAHAEIRHPPADGFVIDSIVTMESKFE